MKKEEVGTCTTTVRRETFQTLSRDRLEIIHNKGEIHELCVHNTIAIHVVLGTIMALIFFSYFLASLHGDEIRPGRSSVTSQPSSARAYSLTH